MNQESETEDHQQLRTQFFAPPGIRFHPSDFELVRFYLLEKIQAGEVHPLVTQLLVRDYDVFASQEPWQIWNYFTATSPFLDKTDLYFFTLLKPRSNTDSRFQRKVGSGTWHGEDGNNKALKFEVAIDNNNRSFTAYKKRFTYKNKGSDQNGCWILYEYSLPSLSTTTVLCQLRNNKNDKGEEDESKQRKRVQSIRTKQRKRVVASASATTHDHAYDGTTNTDTVHNAIAFSGDDQTLYKALEDDPIDPRDQKKVNGAETNHHVTDDSDSFELDALLADCDDDGYYMDIGTVFQDQTNWDGSLSQSLDQEYYQHYFFV